MLQGHAAGYPRTGFVGEHLSQEVYAPQLESRHTSPDVLRHEPARASPRTDHPTAKCKPPATAGRDRIGLTQGLLSRIELMRREPKQLSQLFGALNRGVGRFGGVQQHVMREARPG